MYSAKKENSVTKDGESLFGIADETETIIRFVADCESARKFADFLNEHSVEKCHVPEIAEDIFVLVT